MSSWKTTRRLLLRLARANQSCILGDAWLSGLSAVTSSPGPLARHLVDEIQPTSPILSQESLPAVEVVIPCAPKDFEVLPATVELCVRHLNNPISSVNIVVPEEEMEAASGLNTGATVLGERSALPDDLIEAVRRHHPSGRYGWVLQQVIKLYFAWSSDSAGVLILDSDTLLTHPRAFLDDKSRQILSFSHEYFEPYEHHAAAVWGPRKRHLGLSYVTHHQLMQPWVVREMFPKVDDLVSWVRAASTDRKSSLSDYHSYGRWICDNYPGLVSLARWSNKSVPRHSLDCLEAETIVAKIAERFPSYFSVSLHSYLR